MKTFPNVYVFTNKYNLSLAHNFIGEKTQTEGGQVKTFIVKFQLNLGAWTDNHELASIDSDMVNKIIVFIYFFKNQAITLDFTIEIILIKKM